MFAKFTITYNYLQKLKSIKLYQLLKTLSVYLNLMLTIIQANIVITAKKLVTKHFFMIQIISEKFNCN